MNKLSDWLLIDLPDLWERWGATIGWTVAICWIVVLVLLELKHGIS